MGTFFEDITKKKKKKEVVPTILPPTAPKTVSSTLSAREKAGAQQRRSTTTTAAKPKTTTTAKPATAAASTPQKTTTIAMPLLPKVTPSTTTAASAPKATVSKPTLGTQMASRAQKSAALPSVTAQINQNALAWHKTTDPTQRAKLEAANAALREQSGLSFDANTGRTFSGTTELTAPVSNLYGTAQTRQAARQTMQHTADAARRGTSPLFLQPITSMPRSLPQADNRAEIAQLQTRLEDLQTQYQETQKSGGDTAGLRTQMERTKGRLNQLGAWANPLQRVAMAMDSAKESLRAGWDSAFETSTLATKDDAERKYMEFLSNNQQQPAIFKEAHLNFLEKHALQQQYGAGWEEKLRQKYQDVQNEAGKEAWDKRDAATNAVWSDGSRGFQQAQATQAEAEAGLGQGGKTALQMVNSGSQMLGSAVVATATGLPPGWGTNYLMSLSHAGQASDNAKQMGADIQMQKQYGRALGLTNAAIEGLGGYGSFGLLNTPMKNIKKTAVGKILGNVLEEGAEEALQYEAERRITNGMLGTDQKFDLSQLMANTGMGMAMGGVFGGGTYLGNLPARTAPRNGVLMPEYGKAPMAQNQSTAQEESTAQPAQGAEQAKNPAEAEQILQAQVQPIKVGKATTIQRPYRGKTPGNVQRVDTQRVEIPQGMVHAAQQEINTAAQTGQFKVSIKQTLKNLFSSMGGQRKVTLQNVTFDGIPYEVDLNQNLVKKVASDGHMSPEKLAVFANLDETLRDSMFVGSGSYNKNKAKADNVLRYDYFEKDITCGGKPFVVTFDVEVYHDRNNFRTYKIINEIDLQPLDAIHQSLSSSGVQTETNLSHKQSIPQLNTNVNSVEDAKSGISTPIIPEYGVNYAQRAREQEIIRQHQTQQAQEAGGQAKSPTEAEREEHTPEMQKIIQEYQDSVDDGLISFVNKVHGLQNQRYKNKIKYSVSEVSQKAVEDVKRLTGVDANGFENTISGGAISHIEKRHGKNGVHNRSMSDVKDISRIGYVLDNYDSAELLLDKNGKPVTSYEYANADNTPAKLVQFQKRVNGTFYVVEAAADSKEKRLAIVTAYKEPAIKENGSTDQVLNMPLNDPQPTSNSPHGANAPISSVASETEIVNVNKAPFIPQWEGEITTIEVEPSARSSSSETPLVHLVNAIDNSTSNVIVPQQNVDVNRKTAENNTASAPFMPEYKVSTTVRESPLGDGVNYEQKAREQAIIQQYQEQQAQEAAERLQQMESSAPVATDVEGDFYQKRAQEMQARAMRIAARHPRERAQTRATASEADRYVPEADGAIVESNAAEGLRLTLRSLRKSFRLTDADIVNAEEIAAGRDAVREMDAEKQEKIMAYVQVLRNYQDATADVRQYQAEMHTARARRMDELVTNAERWKDAKTGLGLAIKTPERVFRKVMGVDADVVTHEVLTPIHAHEAQSNAWKREQRAQLKAIVDKYTREEGVYAHLRNRAKELPNDAVLQMKCVKYLEQHRKNINLERAATAEQELTAMTRRIHPEINEAYIRNGVDPLEFRSDYIPSLKPKEGNVVQRILRKIGLETTGDELPTEIAGTTEQRRPGHKYAAFTNERSGAETEFDAFRAMDNYIENAAYAIFHTDDIQILRTLEERLRYHYSDEGTQARLDAIGKRNDLTIEEKTQKREELWENKAENLPHFPTWLREYSNLMAGKKATTDRSAEDMLNRNMYTTMRSLESRVAMNMTGANIGTAITNLIPLAQGSGELSAGSMAQATLQYGQSLVKQDSDFQDRSVFLTNRRGSAPVVRNGLEKAVEIAYTPMAAVDHVSTNILTRARYLDNLKRGKGEAAAMQEAGEWAAGLIADRSVGATPNVFQYNNPLVKLATMFQLEVLNQYGYAFEDVPRNQRGQGIVAVAGVFLKMMLCAYLYNDAAEKLVGRRPAPDPIGIINNFFGDLAGYALPNTLDAVWKALHGDLDGEDFQTEPKTAKDAVGGLLQDVAAQVPFVGGYLGGGRLPIASAAPDVSAIGNAVLGENIAMEKRLATIGKELAKPATYLFPPFGGGQAKKWWRVRQPYTQAAATRWTKTADQNYSFPHMGRHRWTT